MIVAIRMAVRNALRNWRHSLATLCSVAISLVAVAVFHGYMVETDHQFANFYVHRSMYGHIILEKSLKDDSDPWQSQLSPSEADAAVAALGGLDEAIVQHVRFMPIEGIVSGKDSSFRFFGYAYDVSAGEAMRGERFQWNTLYGKPLEEAENPRVVIAKGLAELLGCELKGPTPKLRGDGSYEPLETSLACFQESLQLTGLTEKGRMNAYEVEISGIIDAGMRSIEDGLLLMPLADAQRFYDSKRISMIGVLLKNEADAASVARLLQKHFDQGNLPIKAVLWNEHTLSEMYRSNMLLLETLRNFFLVIVVIVCALSLGNTMTRNIIERTRDIGSLRAIGFKRRFVVILFAWEGFFLGLLGALLGTAIAALLSVLINSSGLSYMTNLSSQPAPLRVALAPGAYLFLNIGLSLVSAGIAAFIASRRAGRSIAESLLHS